MYCRQVRKYKNRFILVDRNEETDKKDKVESRAEHNLTMLLTKKVHVNDEGSL